MYCLQRCSSRSLSVWRSIECLCLACVYSNNIIVRFSTAQQMNIMYTCLLFPGNIKEH